MTRLEELGLIGNCQCSALVSAYGDIVWSCLPRFDSEPAFASLLDEANGGRLSIRPAHGEKGVQRYLENTNVLETTFHCSDGVFRVLDFAPRFRRFDRVYRAPQLVRIVEPITGTPRVLVTCEPISGWSRQRCESIAGSNHVRYLRPDRALRLTTNIPLSYLGGPAFALVEKRHMVFGLDVSLEDTLEETCDRFLAATLAHWVGWVKQCNVPPWYQQAVIRSALVLKLHCFEDTGAIIAATTCSIPEAPGSGRTWDYRYCWLRDGYYSLNAFRLLGQFEERERFLHYLINVASLDPPNLAPLYRIDGTIDTKEWIATEFAGFEGNGPVRVGNAAAAQAQHDVYGEMVLALAPIFLDRRFVAERSSATEALIKRLAERAIAVAGTPDAGIWEYRSAGRSADVLDDDVLGRHGARGAYRSAVQLARARALSRRSRAHPRRPDAQRMERGARRVRRHVWRHGTRRVDVAGGHAATASEGRSAPREHRGGDSQGTRSGRLADALSPRRRPRASGAGIPDLHVLAGRSARAPRSRRRSAGTHGAFARVFVPVGVARRGLRPPCGAAVGQLPAGVLARRPDPRSVRDRAGLEGRAVTRTDSDRASRGSISLDESEDVL
jgi:hypothetical protein